MESFLEEVFRIAQHGGGAELEEIARNTLLLLGHDVTTEQRQFRASDAHPSQFSSLAPQAAAPSVFLNLSDDAMNASRLSKADTAAMAAYMPAKVVS